MAGHYDVIARGHLAGLTLGPHRGTAATRRLPHSLAVLRHGTYRRPQISVGAEHLGRSSASSFKVSSPLWQEPVRRKRKLMVSCSSSLLSTLLSQSVHGNLGLAPETSSLVEHGAQGVHRTSRRASTTYSTPAERASVTALPCCTSTCSRRYTPEEDACQSCLPLLRRHTTQ